jgi:hypothetical protein
MDLGQPFYIYPIVALTTAFVLQAETLPEIKRRKHCDFGNWLIPDMFV